MAVVLAILASIASPADMGARSADRVLALDGDVSWRDSTEVFRGPLLGLVPDPGSVPDRGSVRDHLITTGWKGFTWSPLARYVVG